MQFKICIQKENPTGKRTWKKSKQIFDIRHHQIYDMQNQAPTNVFHYYFNDGQFTEQYLNHTYKEIGFEFREMSKILPCLLTFAMS